MLLLSCFTSLLSQQLINWIHWSRLTPTTTVPRSVGHFPTHCDSSLPTDFTPKGTLHSLKHGQPEIHRWTCSGHSSQRKIAKLEAELEQENAYRKIIEERLIEIRSFRAPIAYLPKELLLQVFSWLALDDPLNLGPILLICKYWKNVAYNSPTLWAGFSIRMKPDAAAIHRQSQFVESAVTFSRKVPLDIELHLPKPLDLWSHLACKMLSISQPRNNKDEEDCARIERWLHTNHRDTYPLVFYRSIDDAVSDHIKALTGEEGRNLHRLRSLTIMFHSADFTRWTSQKSFYYEMPRLERLIVRTYDRPADFRNIFRHPAPRLAFIATNINLMIKWLVRTEGKLTHLTTMLDRSLYHQFPDFRFTRNLTHLYIGVPQTDGWVPTSRGSDFKFPVLQELTVDGMIPFHFIDAPQLTSLRLCDPKTCQEFLGNIPTYPRLTKLHIWAGNLDLENFVIPYIRRLPHLAELGFMYPYEAELIQYLYQIKKCALLENLVIKGLKCSFGMLLHGLDLYDSTPVVEISLWFLDSVVSIVIAEPSG